MNIVETNRENFKRAFIKDFITGNFLVNSNNEIYNFDCKDGTDCNECPLSDFCLKLSIDEEGDTNYSNFVKNFKEISNDVYNIFKEFTEPVLIKKEK